MSCIWTHNKERVAEPSSKESVYIYDAGEYIGLLFPDSSWLCWRVLNRVLDGGVVTETVEFMPADWTPLHVVSLEEYALLSYTRDEHTVSFSIPSWDIDVLVK